MHPFLRTLCCFPFHPRHSPAKSSNLATLREILCYLNDAEEEKQVVINLFIRHILDELSPTRGSEHISVARLGDIDSSPLIRRSHLDVLYSRVQSRVDLSVSTSLSNAEHSHHDIGWIHPTNGDWSSLRVITGTSPTHDNVVADLLKHYTVAQLELMFQLDCMKNWKRYASAANLGCPDPFDLPALLSSPCSISTGGRLRIASWNVNRFTLSKAYHPGFREALCLAILRANISLLLLQEAASVDVASVLCEELNSPTLPHVRQWVNQHRSSHVAHWSAATSIHATGAMFRGQEYAIFLYDTQAGVHIQRTTLLEPRDEARSSKLFTRSPCSALCLIRSTRIVFVSVHLKARGLRNSMVERTASEAEVLEMVVKAFHDTQPADSHLVIAGDFNLNSGHEAFSGLRRHGFVPVLSDAHATTTAVIGSTRCISPQSSSIPCHGAYDNAWLSPNLAHPSSLSENRASYTGDAGVITNDLRHPFIPDDTGAGSNGFVSDHCPIWFDLYVP